MWLVDVYRNCNRIVLWVKNPGNERIETSFTTTIYLEKCSEAEHFLKRYNLKHDVETMQNYLHRPVEVYSVSAPTIGFERFVKWVEEKTRYRVPLYNADITPEQMFLYRNNLTPCSSIDGKDDFPSLKTAEISFSEKNNEVASISLNDLFFEGSEAEILAKFSGEFADFDADVVSMENAFVKLPFLCGRMSAHGIRCSFNRWDDYQIEYRGGASVHSFGMVRYRHYPIRLRGRLLLDSTSSFGRECEPDAIAELSRMTGVCFQQVASKSYGGAFHSSLVKKMVEKNLLVPFKDKPVDRPVSMLQMIKNDRGGHTFDPKPGFHRNVAEIDFSSMFPWLVHNKNISADTILTRDGPFDTAPGIGVRIYLTRKGLVPEAIKPFLDKRMEYKKNPTAVNKAKAKGLKWILVSSYGYLRFREFKLGIATCHAAVCAYAREALMSAVMLCEENRFELIHAIVDSLFIRKPGLKEQEVQELCRELESFIGVPACFEGMFKWVVFLPSINNPDRPVPARYFGVYTDGRIKARGIEVRQRSSPLIVRHFQQKALETMSKCNTKSEVIGKAPEMLELLHRTLHRLNVFGPEGLAHSIYLGKEAYTRNIPQKSIIKQLKKKGISAQPGQMIQYIMQEKGPVLTDDYNGRPGNMHYKKLLVRALFVLLQPFGFTKEQIYDLTECSRQTKLPEFEPIRTVYFPADTEGRMRAGLSERYFRKKLEGQGWQVWRGAMISITRQSDVYPNVMRRYSLLARLLEKHKPGLLEHLQYICDVHHGLPDFICFRNGEFKLVECKLEHEQLSSRQKKCIRTLSTFGFNIEVHRLMPRSARAKTVVNSSKSKTVVEQQLRIAAKAK